MTTSNNKHSLVTWREHLKMIQGLAQELLMSLETDDQLAKQAGKKAKYSNFLRCFEEKLELLNNTDVVRVGRPHSSSEDNICISYRYNSVMPPTKMQILGDLVQLDRRDDSADNFLDPSGQRIRKFSFQIHEESEEKKERLIQFQNENQSSTMLGRRRQNSMDY